MPSLNHPGLTNLKVTRFGCWHCDYGSLLPMSAWICHTYKSFLSELQVSWTLEWHDLSPQSVDEAIAEKQVYLYSQAKSVD